MRLFLLLLVSVTFAQQSLSEVLGINADVGLYDSRQIERFSHVITWLREYHKWDFYELEDELYGWDHTTKAFYGSTWPYHTFFMQECVENNIKVLLCAEDAATWVSPNKNRQAPPFGQNDGSSEVHYIDKAEFLGQLVGRYGSIAFPPDKIEAADSLTGLNYVQYYEDHNEPDKYLVKPLWTGQNYGKYLNAAHDGFGLQTSETYPLLGIKSVDSTAVHVMGGLLQDNTDYLDAILQGTGGRLPFDVLNFHHYCSNFQDGDVGFAPEYPEYGFELTVRQMQKWRDKHAPGMPIWCTEFGWDTALTPDGKHSYIYAPERQQANYLLRSIFLLMGYGVEKAFIFLCYDLNSYSDYHYESSGIVRDHSTAYEAKPAFYYFHMLKFRFGHMVLEKVEKYRDGSPELYSYILADPLHPRRKVYVMWCRDPHSKTDNGTTINNYHFDLPKMTDAVLITPQDGEKYGLEEDLDMYNYGEENAYTTIPEISEKPLFLQVKLERRDTQTFLGKPTDFGMRSFPNPFNSAFTFAFDLRQSSRVEIDLFNVRGQFIEQLLNQQTAVGHHQVVFDFSTKQIAGGVYLLRFKSDDAIVFHKILYVP